MFKIGLGRFKVEIIRLGNFYKKMTKPSQCARNVEGNNVKMHDLDFMHMMSKFQNQPDQDLDSFLLSFHN